MTFSIGDVLWSFEANFNIVLDLFGFDAQQQANKQKNLVPVNFFRFKEPFYFVYCVSYNKQHRTS